jgi:hypothetical protein
MSDFNWICPHCEHAVTISSSRYSSGSHTLKIPNAIGRRTLITKFIVCPNPKCLNFTLTATLHESAEISNMVRERIMGDLQNWELIPNSSAKNFPSYIPSQILADYKESCLIKSLSPKASATLSRRCLQGILRDFWGVKPGTLFQEIDAIKDIVDPITWSAIDAVRTLGNIGAHMEKDINVIVDVDPEEASQLIGLVETLLREWYVGREERRVRMEALVAAATSKKPPQPLDN